MLVTEILPRARALYPRQTATICGGERQSYAQLAERVDRLASGLRSLGLAAGDRIAILHRNSHRYLETYFAAAQAGLILCPLNHRLSAAELDVILEDAGARVLIAEPCFAERAGELSAGLQVIFAPEAYEELIDTSEATLFPRPAVDDAILLYYTSGTAGHPKGVVLTHRNTMAHALSSIAELGLGDADIWIHAAPMFHLADAWATWALTWVGGRHLFVPRFEPEVFLDSIEREGVTITNLVPAMLNRLVHHPSAGRHDLSSLRVLLSGGAPIAPELVRRIMDIFGCDYIQTYGMTETSPYLTMSILKEHLRQLPAEKQFTFKASTGRPVLGIELKVLGETGHEVAADGKEVGEIVVRGDAVTRGYWNLPEESAAAIRDGWLHTGDLAVIDAEGYVNIVDRKKDMIVTGGENVYSTEVENVLFRHPAVLEVAVFGRPDSHWGEAVTAAVVLKPGSSASEDELIDFCRRHIAGYKAPRSVHFLDELPKTGSGKIAKRRLRERNFE